MKYLRALLSGAFDRVRAERFLRAEDTPNGSTKLQALLQALEDAEDSLDGIAKAIEEDDNNEALRLIVLAHESITDHIHDLRELL